MTTQLCPDCERLSSAPWCGSCGRQIDGRPSTLTARTERHLRRLAELEISTRGHGAACITRETGGWAAPSKDPGNLRQTCPCCGRDEYRGSFCSGCGIPVGALDWHRPLMTAAQAAVLARGQFRFVHPRENGPSCVEEARAVHPATEPEQLSTGAPA